MNESEGPETADLLGGVSALTESVKDYAIFLLRPDGTVASWNPGAQAIKGYAPSEIVGESFIRFFTPEDLAAGKPGRLLAAAARDGRVEDEGWRLRKDGSRFWADVVISRIEDDAGNLIGFAKVTRDLTERKQAEESLAARARQQAAVARLGLVALAETGIPTLLRHATETVRETLAVPFVEVLEVSSDRAALVVRASCSADPALAGRPDLQLSPRTAAGFTLLTGEPAVLGSRPFEQDETLRRLEVGGGVTVVIHGSDPAAAYGVLGAYATDRRVFSVEDVNFLQAVANVIAAAISRGRMEQQVRDAERDAQDERTRTFRAREALRERDEFISVAAHELRTPLTALQLQLQGLERALETVAGQGHDRRLAGSRVDGALRQTERLTVLVERLLDASRIAGGRLQLDPEKFDLAGLVRQVGDDFREAAAAAGSELHVDAAAGAEGSWDRLRLEQVLVNLLSNAVKYGAGRPISVRLSIEQERIHLSVADRGIGIAAEDLPRLFTRFERAAPVRHYGGLGLGLFISKHIVEAHGGEIHVSSSAGEGSTFVVELPRFALRTPALPGGRQARA